jgi:hypothetical protein
MKKSSEIKQKIKEVLETLRRSEVLKDVQIRDISESIFDLDLALYPAAILTPPSIVSEIYTNVDNLRTYNFEILVIMRTESITEENSVEELMETLIDTFDNLPSLDGIAEGGLEPATSPTESITARGKTWTIFRVILKAKSCARITL